MGSVRFVARLNHMLAGAFGLQLLFADLLKYLRGLGALLAQLEYYLLCASGIRLRAGGNALAVQARRSDLP